MKRFTLATAFAAALILQVSNASALLVNPGQQVTISYDLTADWLVTGGTPQPLQFQFLFETSVADQFNGDYFIDFAPGGFASGPNPFNIAGPAQNTGPIALLASTTDPTGTLTLGVLPSGAAIDLQLAQVVSVTDNFDNSAWDNSELSLTIPTEVDAVAAPEPATFALFGLGVLGLIGLRRRREKA